MGRHMIGILVAAVVAAGGTSRASADDFKLVVQPDYPPERAQEVYAPLERYLERATEHRFELVTPRDFHRYWSEMRRNDDWDFVFDDAHFTDFRIDRFGYVPLVRAAEDASFTMVAGYDVEADAVDDLVGRQIVTMPAPSLGFATLTRWYRDPLRQPVIVSTATTWRDTTEIIFAGEADAAIVPTWLAQRYPNLLPIAVAEPVPGPAISAAPDVPVSAREEVTRALLALHEDRELYEVLVELNISRFERADRAAYDGARELLTSFFGY